MKGLLAIKMGVVIWLICLNTGLLFGADPRRDWNRLFNGKDLADWETFLRPGTKTDPDYGLNQDPEKVFTVDQVDGGPVIHVSGKYLGGLITTQSFENYHLRLEFKWGKKTWAPRLNLT